MNDADRGEHVGDLFQQSLRSIGQRAPEREAAEQEANYPAAIAALEAEGCSHD